MQELNFNNAAEAKKISNGPLRLAPGVYDNVYVSEIKAVESASPYMEVTFLSEDGSGQHVERFYMTEKAMPYSLMKIKEIITALDAQVPEVTNVETLSLLISGKKLALRLNGREVQRTDGQGTWIASELSQSPFCAPAGQANIMKFDEAKAIKRLSTIKPLMSDETKSDGLPF